MELKYWKTKRRRKIKTEENAEEWGKKLYGEGEKWCTGRRGEDKSIHLVLFFSLLCLFLSFFIFLLFDFFLSCFQFLMQPHPTCEESYGLWVCQTRVNCYAWKGSSCSDGMNKKAILMTAEERRKNTRSEIKINKWGWKPRGLAAPRRALRGSRVFLGGARKNAHYVLTAFLQFNEPLHAAV